MKHLIALLFFAAAIFTSTVAQEDDLESLLMDEIGEVNEKVLGTFLSTFVLNNPSVELLDAKGLSFRVSHKFGYLNSGPENFCGFDHSSVFTGAEFGVTNWFNIGIGRDASNKTVDTQAKLRILRQSEGKRNIPVSVVLLGELDYSTKEYTNEEIDAYRAGRVSYTTQLLVARKINKMLSVQVMPGFTHKNLVNTAEDANDLFSLGFGSTLRVAKRLRLNLEYFWVQEHNTSKAKYHHPVSAGICYQTSRHAFEVYLTNSQGITLLNHISNTSGDIADGDVCIGFNISTVFSVKR